MFYKREQKKNFFVYIRSCIFSIHPKENNFILSYDKERKIAESAWGYIIFFLLCNQSYLKYLNKTKRKPHDSQNKSKYVLNQ